jgi:short-subunit dehydrogenase
VASEPWKTAIVVGASSGMGADIARRLAASGCRVGLVAHRADELEAVAAGIRERHGPDSCTTRVHDVTDYDAAPEVWAALVEELGPIDFVAYVAGVMPQVGPSEYTFAKDRQMVEVNLLGAVAWLNQAALEMESARGGTILGVSSVAGDRGRRGAPVYGASKAALNTYLESLRNRLSRYGVRVVTVRPGFVRTPMTAGLDLPERMVISSERAAELILAAGRKGKTNAYIPAKWRLILFVIRNIPSFVFRRMSI